MTSVSMLRLGVIALAGLLAGVSARAEDAPANCEVPDYLLATESKLPKVAAAIKGPHLLNILVLGSRSSTINASDGAAYPSRLQVALKDKLPPSVAVNVSVELQARKTAEEVAKGLVSLLEGKKPNLVIWQTGTFDRFAIMRQWNDHGDFDLFSASPGVELARRVHDCLGRALSTFMISAAHLGAEQQN
jgi:hypothetical protein